jgi:hypothetical protein
MNKNLNRRNALKLAAAAGGLFAVEKIASAAPPLKQVGLAGNWLASGQPAAIWQQGPVLIVVNEGGAVGGGLMTSANTFVIQFGYGWDPGLTAEVANGGQLINWANGSQWQRA